MEKTPVTQLICQLLAIINFAKDIHYTCEGNAFYSKHMLVDRVQENLSEYIDNIKETFLLANEIAPLPSGEYLSQTVKMLPGITIGDDKLNFIALQNLVVEALALMEEMDDLTRGESSLLDKIAEDLQNSLGLINQQIKD